MAVCKSLFKDVVPTLYSLSNFLTLDCIKGCSGPVRYPSAAIGLGVNGSTSGKTSLEGAGGNGSSTGGLRVFGASTAFAPDLATAFAPLRNRNNGIKLIPDSADKAILPAAPSLSWSCMLVFALRPNSPTS